MSEPQFQPYIPEDSTIGDDTSRSRFLSGIRRRGPDVAVGIAGGAAAATVVVLAAAGLAPLLGGAAATAGIAWLQSLGVNALAGWLGNWSAGESGRLFRRLRDGGDDEAGIGALAAALQAQMETDGHLADDVARLLESTQSVATLLESLPTRREQEDLLQALRNDLQRTYLAQGEMQYLLSHAVEQMTERLQAIGAGVRALQPAQSLIVTHEQFFAPYLRRGRLFNHLLTLVGRGTQLDTLFEFSRSERHQAAILPGPGGAGKSKLLLEFAQRRGAQLDGEGVTVRFVSDGVPVSPAALNEVPPGSALLVIDDAQRRDDLGPVFHLAARRASPIKLVVATRPQAVGQLRFELQQAGFDTTEIVELPRLEPLPPGDVEELAREVLGPEYAHHAEALAAVSRDCPLVTVIGGRLLTEQAIPPSLLTNHESFRNTVLYHFRDEIIGSVSQLLDPQLCRRLMDLLSILAPIRMNNDGQLEAMAAFLGIARPELIRALGFLEDAGVLLRRGYTLRIMPDVLSDFILHEACFTQQGVLTGYAEQVYNAFRVTHRPNILRNLAELDWRIQAGGGNEPDVLAEVWQSVRSEFARGSDGERYGILNTLLEVAIYQPARVLPLVERAMTPSPTPAPDRSAQPPLHQLLYGQPGHEHLLHLLPQLLRRIAYWPDYLPRCCDLLWQLGRDDGRSLNPTPEHAIRVLQDLASYDSDKPPLVNCGVVEAVGLWLREPDAHSHLHSPLDVLDPVFSKSGHTDRTRGNVITWSPFFVHRENTQPLRDRAFELLSNCLESIDLKVRLRVIESLRKAAAPPAEYNGLTITPDIQAEWLPEQLRALDMLESIACPDAHPLVLMRVGEAVGFSAHDRRVPEIAERAREIAARIPDTFGLRLARALTSNPADAWALDDDDAETPDAYLRLYERRTEAAVALRRAVAREVVERYAEPGSAVTELNVRLVELQTFRFDHHPEWFVFELGAVNMEYGSRLCEALINAPVGPLTYYLPVLLSAIRLVDAERALVLSNRALATGDATLCAALANSETWRNWERPPSAGDLGLLRALAANSHALVRIVTLRTLATLAWRQPDAVPAVIDIALGVDVGEDLALAEALCAAFDARLGVPPGRLSEEQLAAVLSKLLPVKSLGGGLAGTGRAVFEFLSAASQRVPVGVVGLFMDRLHYAENAGGPDYEPVPYHFYGLDLSGLATSERYDDILRRVRDYLLEGPPTSRFWVQHLFAIVSLHFGASSLPVLDEWIDSGDPSRIEGASILLAEAPPNFVFEHEAMTVRLLERAHAAGAECQETIQRKLYGCATSRQVSHTVGEASPQLLHLVESAGAAALRATPASAARTFYTDLADWARSHMEYEAMSDEEIMDY